MVIFEKRSGIFSSSMLVLLREVRFFSSINTSRLVLYFNILGVPLSQIPHTWAPGEPDNYEGREDCIILLTNGSMADAICSYTYPYMCYKKKADLVITECGTSDPGNTLNRLKVL
jgi:hypothetical protein